MNEKRPPRRKRPPLPTQPALLVPPEQMDFDRRLRKLPTSFGSRYGACFLGFVDLFNARVAVQLNPQIVPCAPDDPQHAYLDFSRRNFDLPWQATYFHPPDAWVRWDEGEDDNLSFEPIANRCLKDIATATCQHLSFHPALALDVLDIIYQRRVHECHYRLQELTRLQTVLGAHRTPTPCS